MSKLIGKLNPVSWFKRTPQAETVGEENLTITFVMLDKGELSTMRRLKTLVEYYEGEVPGVVEESIYTEHNEYVEDQDAVRQKAEEQLKEMAECSETSDEIDGYVPDYHATGRG